MRIFILHGYVEDVGSILLRLASISPARARQVLPTRDVTDVRRAVVSAEIEGESVFVVVTGNGLTTRAYNTMIQLTNQYRRRVLFFAYTSLGTAERLHGIIPREIKGEDHELVANVLAFVAEGTTVDDIVARFESVTSNLQSVK